MTSLLIFTREYSLITNTITTIFGIFGNSLNILTFTKLKAFENNQCIFYLLAESIVNLIAVIFYFIIRILITQYGSDFTPYITTWCRLKIMIVQTILLFPLFVVCFAAMDQYLATNSCNVLRQMSTLKLARSLLFSSLGFSLMHSIGFGLFFYARSPVDCGLLHPILMRYYSYFFYPILCGFLPLFISGLCSLLAYRNVRRIIRRQLPIVRRRLDRQLTKFVLLRVTFHILLLAPFIIYRAYAIHIHINPNDSFRLATDRLLLAIFGSFFNLNYTVIVNWEIFRTLFSFCVSLCR